ncbi:MAG: tRNA preQ1(34) S-adenosylmethionine ribosyltransferase-isomerase QueA [Phycisphaerales bacterium]
MNTEPLRTDQLDFDLPKDLIATCPVEPRDSSRLLVVQRSNPDRLEDRVFSDLPGLLASEDVLVFNRSKVVPARLVGENAAGTGGRFEGLYLYTDPDSTRSQPTYPIWIALIKAKRAKPGKRYRLDDARGQSTQIVLELIEPFPSEGPGAWMIRVHDQAASESETESSQSRDSSQILEAVGHTPLPPYILAQRKARSEDPGDRYDRSHYQTLYASGKDLGSVAAPTAGLHFTDSVLDALEARSIHKAEVVLHVGAGTFKPIETETINEHPMHAETCSLGSASSWMSQAHRPRTIAVGSTSARTLESFAQLAEKRGTPEGLPESYSTRILIQPGYRWRWVDGMVTNFHLPRSTLLAMVASLLDMPDEGINGLERIQSIYAHAIHERYRFFSYGDAMLILP